MKSNASGLSIAVPGELKCFTRAHELYGKLDWDYLLYLVGNFTENEVIVTGKGRQSGRIEVSANG